MARETSKPTNRKYAGGGERVDAVRASRDGHAFHETWAARSALALLPPGTRLTAIAMEGFTLEDEVNLGAPAIEVADLVRYYGGRTLEDAERVEVVQFKYSISNADVPVRAADLAKTLTKFGRGEMDRVASAGSDAAARVHYEFATNRPIADELLEAVVAIGSGAEPTSAAARQAQQLRDALSGHQVDVRSLFARLTLSGALGSLQEGRTALGRSIASWSAPGDPAARIRLRNLQHLVREKAEHSARRNKVIDRVALLDEFGVNDEGELYPTPDAFPPVLARIARPILDDIVAEARTTRLPLLLHGEGGMGKTVLMQGLAERLASDHEVIIFDGYGAGKWRDPARPRHLGSRTLLHLANLLAARGLCDILLPGQLDDAVLRAFRSRLEQAVEALRLRNPTAGVALVLDAIDHAGIVSQDTGEKSFAHSLFASLAIDPIEGVIVVGSCRTERIHLAVGRAQHSPFRVPAFSHEEARRLILARDPSATIADMAALETRSGRNPRCLDAFLTSGRPYEIDVREERNPETVLDSILLERIENARQEALRRGGGAGEIDLLLSGLAMLPPPVPLFELAAARGLSTSDVESFAADLSPLLERTRHGLMFRDEPIETLIGKISKENLTAREAVIERLQERQDRSEYAARALPVVLTAAGRTDQLISLAFDDHVPSGASDIGKREIRMARIVAAAQGAARAGRSDDLCRLALEASLVAAGHERADRFLYEHPDLAAISGDSEALRRLFATKTGWPGGRHSALAIAYQLSGESEEAERHAARAIDWFNHRIKQRSDGEYAQDRPSSALDEVGFAFVELLAGRHRRILEWLGRSSDGVGYRVFSGSLDLAERDPATDRSALAALRDAVVEFATGARGVLAATLAWTDGDEARDRTLAAALAATEVGPSPESGVPSEALLSCAIRAAAIGSPTDARAIAASFESRTRTTYSFDDYHRPDLDPVIALVAAGLTAALARRDAGLVDLAPVDLLERVPSSIRRRGPAVFARELDRRLKGSTRARRGTSARRKRDDPDAVERRRWEEESKDRQRRLVQHRLVPLLPYATFAGRLIRAPATKRNEIVADWLDRLEQDVRTASNYPYRDGAEFLARAGGLALVLCGTAVRALDALSLQRLAALLAERSKSATEHLLWAAKRLSRLEGAEAAVLLLATRIEQGIKAGTDTRQRIREYGRLARCAWRASPEEAAAYFRRGLDLAEAMGSDDFDRANLVLRLGSSFHGPPLAPQSVHSLARILELHLGDDDRYPWTEWADAMRGAAGSQALPILSRLDDRRGARLEITLHPTLTALAADGVIPADVASALVGIVEPQEYRHWRLDQFVSAVRPGLSPEDLTRLFELLLVEIDRKDGLTPHPQTIGALITIAAEAIPAAVSVISRLTALRRDPPPSDEAPLRGEEENIAPIAETDLGDPNAIEEAIEADAEKNGGHRWPRRALSALAAQATSTGNRLRFLRSLPTVSGADLEDKLEAIANFSGTWSVGSAAVRDALPALALALVTSHPDDVVDTSWHVQRTWQRLVELGLTRDTIAKSAVTALGADASEISGEGWLSLATELAPAASQPALGAALDRFLTLAGADIPEEIGDGPWRAEFAGPSDPVEVAAGLVWARLGNPAAPMRWRAAHALVRLADFGRFDVVDTIVARLGGSAGAFSDRQMPFFAMHAQLWALLGLARIARLHPERIVPHRPLLERISFSTEFPHAAMREASIRALGHLLPLLPDDDGAALRGRLARANRSPFPPSRRDGYRYDVHQDRPEGRREPRTDLFFDYDFNKYQIATVMRLFGVEAWKVRDTVSEWVRRWDPTVASMSQCPRTGSSDDRTGSWSSGSPPEVDRYGGYLAWHALQVTAGNLLAHRPVTKADWDSDRWEGFVREVGLSRQDGTWLSEWSDLTPVDLRAELPMPSRQREALYDEADEQLLAPLVGIHEGNLKAPRFIVGGDWSPPSEVTVSVSTLLAPAEIARAAVLASLTVNPFFRLLPRDEDDKDRDFGSAAPHVRCWIDAPHHTERQLDRYDPYASSAAQSRRYPGEWLQKVEGIERFDAAGRIWTRRGIPVFFAEAWGGPEGRYEKSGDRGERLLIDTTYLLDLLRRHGLVLAGLVKADLYRKRDRRDSEGAFIYRTLGFLLDGAGRVTIPKRLPRGLRHELSTLSRQHAHDFDARFSAALRIVRGRHR